MNKEEAQQLSAGDLPFKPGPRNDRMVVSSLDGRDGLRNTVEDLLTRLKAQEETSPAAGPAPVLMIRGPNGNIETTYVAENPRCLIGRDNCDLQLQDRFVARWHAQLFRRDGALLLQDLGTTNGVYLRIADDLALEDGDRIALGQQRFEFRTTWDTPDHAPDAAVPAGATWPGSPARLIRYLEGEQIGGVYPVGNQLVIGAQQGDIYFPEDPQLAATHALIRVEAGSHAEPDRYLLRDLDSEFGTFIRIANAVELIDGDCFLVGRTQIRLTFP